SIDHIVAFFQDITERKKAERSIQNAKDFAEHLIETANVLFLQLDSTGKILRVNKAAEEITGYSRSEIEGKDWGELLVPRNRFPHVWEEFNRITTQGELTKIFENPIVTKSGEERHILWKNNVLWENDRLISTISFGMDITERKKAEEKLEFQSQLLGSVGESVISTDLNGSIKYWNKAAEKMFGWKSEEVIGKNIINITASDNSEKQVQEIMNRLKKGKTWAGEFETKRKDGTSFFINVTDSPVLNVKGELAGIIGISSDITEKKRIQEKLEKSEQLLSDAQQIAHLGSWELNHTTCELFWSDEIYKLFGLNPEVDKTSYNTYLEYIHPDDRSHVDASFTNSLMKINDNYEVEYRITKKNTGEIRFVKGKWRNVKNSSGRVIKSIGTVQDITGEVLANKEIRKLSTAIEQSQISVMITDTQGKIQYVNAKFRDVTGYNLEEVVNKSPNILKSGKQPKEFYEKLWSNILSGNTWQGELQNKKKSGELFWENVIISPMVDKQGRIINFIAVKEDITDKKRMIEELISSKEKADEANRIKSYFLANMSHELRTPMVGILGFAELLVEELTDPNHIDMASIIISSGSRLIATLNSILDLSRIEANKQDIIIAPVNLVEIIKEAVHLYEPLIKSKNIYLKYSFPENNIYLNSDRDILYKIFNNLINNAVKYT
ncbi:MAG TPA: PAS domain S-box protein, partial [Ignavibacteriaceae bacterium]|nr:PAS domain S-box protein [Ignavibacteriaceae bacterium]